MNCVSVSKFKARISDVIKPDQDDYETVKWLKGECIKRKVLHTASFVKTYNLLIYPSKLS